MVIEVRPATDFDDVRTLVGPKRADATVCWCLSYRIPSQQNISLRGEDRRIPCVDNRGSKVDLTMAYVGTRKLFEDAGFTKAAGTRSVLNGFPRVLMRLELA
jgi:hypothetical protein